MPLADRASVVEAVIAGYETLMHSLAASHAPDFLEIDITMPQAKVLYLVGAAGELHMSTLAQRLGVSLSTVSGLVDRVVDHGLAARREDPTDRRQVLVGLTPDGSSFIDRFRELNARQMRELLDALDDTELETLRSALTALARAAERLAPSPPRLDRPSPATASTAAPAAGAPARKDIA